METFKQAWVTYFGMAIAVFAIVAGVFGWVDTTVVWGVAGIFGFGSVASLRAYIDSEGWKTYVATGIPIVAGILTMTKVITIEQYQALVAAFAPLTAGTLQAAQTKAKAK